MNSPNIPLSPDVVLQLWNIAITNAQLTFTGISLLVVWALFLMVRNLSIRPWKTQIVLEEFYSFFQSKIDMTGLDTFKKKILLSIVLTLFILIIISNLFSIAPILSSLTISVAGENAVPFFRSPTSHFSLTIALGIFVVIGWNLTAFLISPMKYVGNFIKIGPLFRARSVKDFLMGILDVFLGVMDIISEIAKVISVSARLFGNVIAGEIIAVVIVFLVPFIIPIPFFILSLFSGLIQAFVFALLSMQFIAWSIANVSSAKDS